MRAKKSLLLPVLFVLNAAAAQWAPGVYMKQATNRTLATAKYIEANSNSLGFSDGLCFMGTLLQANGGNSSITIHLDAYTKYSFVGGGDDDVTDIDIKLESTGGTLLASDTKRDNYPVVNFTPSYSGSYSLRLINYSSTKAFAAVAILQEGGVGLPVDNMGEAVDNIFSMCRGINERTSQKLWFLDEDNQWCFYGYVLGNGNSRTVSNIKMGYGKRYVIAAADDNARDIDVCIMNGTADTEYKCDKESDATPITSYRTSSLYNYGLKVNDVRSAGKTFVLACILKEDD